MSKEIEHVQFVSTCRKDEKIVRHVAKNGNMSNGNIRHVERQHSTCRSNVRNVASTCRIRHVASTCCWCGRGFKVKARVSCRKYTSNALRYGTRFQDLTVLLAHSALIRWRNEPYLSLPSQPKLVLIYWPRRDGRLSWPCVAGWLHTEINVRHRKLNPDTIAHLNTNQARRRLTLLIEAN